MLNLLNFINGKSKDKSNNYSKVDKLFTKAMYRVYKEEQKEIHLELKQKKLELDVQKKDLLASLRLHKKELEDQGKLKTQTKFEWLKDLIFNGIIKAKLL